MASYGSYGRGRWCVVYPEQTNRFGTEAEARAWAAEHGGKVVQDDRESAGNLFEAAAISDRADGRRA
jgi:nitrous oxide reductase accessory protein NosL